MTRRALVVTHGGREEAVVATAEAVRELEAAGIEPVHDAATTTSDAHDVDLTGVEFTIVLGRRRDDPAGRGGHPRGRASRVLGVNLGHVGFLAESEREDIAEAVRRIADGDYEVEERGTLEVRAMLPGEPEPVLASWALNEATVEKGDRDRMIEVVVEVDGRPLSSFGCDGVVMSTSTGSTAYAFSAGGPVVWPDVDGMILVPVSAHALFARPLVVGPRQRPGGRGARAGRRRPAWSGATADGGSTCRWARASRSAAATSRSGSRGSAARPSPTGWSASSRCRSRAGAAAPPRR